MTRRAFGETPASLDKTRQIVEGNDVSRTRVFEPVKEESEDYQKSGMPGETFSIGKFVESVMADAKKQENASTVLEDETAVDKKLLKKTVRELCQCAGAVDFRRTSGGRYNSGK